MNEANPTAAMLVIGDEILSGRTRDANMHHLAGVLADHGIDLIEARIVPDSTDNIVASIRAMRDRCDHLFTSGGIGPTHDDITADAVAQAFDVGISLREDARAIIAARCKEHGLELNAARLRMARIPDGASLIANPVSGAPGFSIGNTHVMAGVPKIFRAMLEGLLTRIPGGRPLAKRVIEVCSPEGELAAEISRIAETYPQLQIGSYPFRNADRFGVSIVLRGTEAAHVQSAEAELREVFADCLVTAEGEA